MYFAIYLQYHENEKNVMQIFLQTLLYYYSNQSYNKLTNIALYICAHTHTKKNNNYKKTNRDIKNKRFYNLLWFIFDNLYNGTGCFSQQ